MREMSSTREVGETTGGQLGDALCREPGEILLNLTKEGEKPSPEETVGKKSVTSVTRCLDAVSIISLHY